MKYRILTAAIACFFLASGSILACNQKKVVLGDEQFDRYIPQLEGKRVAVFSNQTGIVGDVVKGSKLADVLKATNGCFLEKNNSPELDAASMIPFLEPSTPGGKIEYGPHLVDALLAKGIDVQAIFSPEHGFRGNADAGEHVSSSVDPQTGVAILSLYEKGSHMPSKESMDKFDILLVDIQDVGLRYYTYYITMHHLMEACAKYGKKMIVLDRPNPNGFYVDGATLDMQYKSGIGWLPIPVVHGMTFGELALMINGEGWLEGGAKCDLEVVPCRNYTHSTRYSLILPPSPNLKDMKSVYLYSSTCFFEGTEVTTARGTQFPFEAYGSPKMTDHTFTFTPRSIPGAKTPRFQDQLCYGTDLRGLTLQQIWDKGVDLSYIIDAYKSMTSLGEPFFGKGNSFPIRVGRDYIREMIEAGATAEQISARWQDDVKEFKKLRKPYLLYK